jgi:hypothetical protein
LAFAPEIRDLFRRAKLESHPVAQSFSINPPSRNVEHRGRDIRCMNPDSGSSQTGSVTPGSAAKLENPFARLECRTQHLPGLFSLQPADETICPDSVISRGELVKGCGRRRLCQFLNRG